MPKYKLKFGDGTEKIIEAEKYSDAFSQALDEAKEKKTSVTVEN